MTSGSATKPGRLAWVDWAKFIGIYMVVLAHMKELEGKWLILAFVMPFFFMLSGYLYKKVPLRKELSNCWKSLLVPYLIFNAVLVAVCIALGQFDAGVIWNILLGNQELLPGRYFRPLWFLISLLVMRVVSASLPERFYIAAVIISFVSGFVLLEYGLLQNGQYTSDYFQLQTTLICYPYFLAGYLMKRHSVLEALDKRRRSRPFLFVVILAVLLAASAAAGYFNGGVNVFNCKVGKSVAAYYAVALVLSMSVMYLCKVCLNHAGRFVTTTATGTIFIIGTHVAVIDGLCYGIGMNSLYSLALSVAIMLVSFLCISLILKRCPFIIGR